MTLAETYLLASDLRLLTNLNLTDFIIKNKYFQHNPIKEDMLFPITRMYGGAQTTYPRLLQIGRWGRNIIFKFTTCTVVIKMSYRSTLSVYRGSKSMVTDASDLIMCFLESGGKSSSHNTYLFYKDVLRCGAVSVYQAGDVPEEFGYLGMDVLDSSFTGEYLISELFKETYENPTKNIKSFLMDRGVLAWIDNDIVSEVLFVMGICPASTVTDFNPDGAAFLVKTIKTVYGRFISHMRNDFQNTDLVPISSLYSVFDRDGQECSVCDAIIQRTVIDGLVTYWCPKCQRVKQKEHAV